MPYDVAVTAWTKMAVCPHYDPLVLDVIRNFRDTYIGNGPEQQIPSRRLAAVRPPSFGARA